MPYIIPTTIVSGFPAIGKSTAAKLYPTFFRDLESSDFHWIPNQFDENNEKVLNPQWPQNYINQIKALEKSGMYSAVCVSSHHDIRKLMAENGIKYTNLYPKNDFKTKNVILRRMRVRQSPDSMIELIDKNWDSFINDMATDKGSVTNLELDERSLEDWIGWCMMR